MAAKVHAAHILVEKLSQAEAILDELKEGKSFEDLAKEKSLCPSRKRGGDLGWFGKNQMVKPFEQACFKHEVGLIEEPVKTQFGYHIIKVLEKK